MIADINLAEMFTNFSMSKFRRGLRYCSESDQNSNCGQTAESKIQSRQNLPKLWSTVSNDSGIGVETDSERLAFTSTSDQSVKSNLLKSRKSLDGTTIAHQISPQNKGFNNISAAASQFTDTSRVLLMRHTVLGPAWTYGYSSRIGVSGILNTLQTKAQTNQVAFNQVPVFYESVCHCRTKNDRIINREVQTEAQVILNGDYKYGILKNADLGRGNFGQVHTCNVSVRQQEDGIYKKSGPLRAMKSTYKMSTYRKERDVHNYLQNGHTQTSYQTTFLLWMEQSLKVELNARLVGFLLLELAIGGSLQELVTHLHKTKKHLTEQESVFYLCEIGCALDYLHQRNFLHLDLKADNVLIHASGHIRLGDLGHALKLENGERAVSYLSAGLCTYHLPVEILRESSSGTSGKVVTKSTDWFSYGCLAFWLLHNHYPIIPPSYICSTREYAEYMNYTGYNRLPKVFTVNASMAYKQMVTGLLNPDPTIRLGNLGGFNQILQGTDVFSKSGLFTSELPSTTVRQCIESNSLIPPFIPLPLHL